MSADPTAAQAAAAGVEVAARTRHDAMVLAQELAAAVEAYRRDHSVSVARIAKDAGMSQQALDRFLRRAREPEYSVESSTLEAIAGAIGMRWTLGPAADESLTESTKTG